MLFLYDYSLWSSSQKVLHIISILLSSLFVWVVAFCLGLFLFVLLFDFIFHFLKLLFDSVNRFNHWFLHTGNIIIFCFWGFYTFSVEVNFCFQLILNFTNLNHVSQNSMSLLIKCLNLFVIRTWISELCAVFHFHLSSWRYLTSFKLDVFAQCLEIIFQLFHFTLCKSSTHFTLINISLSLIKSMFIFSNKLRICLFLNGSLLYKSLKLVSWLHYFSIIIQISLELINVSDSLIKLRVANGNCVYFNCIWLVQ